MRPEGTRRSLVRHARILAVLTALLVSSVGVFGHGLWTPDEPRQAEVGREMWEAGWSSMPTLGGEPFLEKPPLHPWVMAAAYRLFGVSPGVARLPSALFAFGSILVAYGMGRRAGGRLTGLFSAVVLATTFGFVFSSHKALVDNPLAFFVAVGHLALFEARERARWPRIGEGVLAPLALAGLACALAFLSKGVIGPVLLLGPPLLAALAMREFAFVLRILPGLTLTAGLALTALGLPWVLSLGLGHGWDKVRVCLIDNTIGRTAAGQADGYGFGHEQGPLYYLKAFPFMTLPWIVALPGALSARTFGRDWHAGRVRFLGLTVLAGVLLLSLPATKREIYLIPLLPAASVVVGAWLARAGAPRQRKLDRILLAVIAGVCGLVALGGAWTGLGLPAPAAVGDLRAAAPTGWVVVGLVLLALFVAALRVVAGLFRGDPAVGPARVAGLLLGLVLCTFAAVPTLVDPLKDMRAGALELARAVPADERLFALRPDETIRAVVPFYSGRLLHRIVDPAQLFRKLEEGGATHLIVQRGREKHLDAESLARLRAVKTVALSATRTATVYVLLDG